MASIQTIKGIISQFYALEGFDRAIFVKGPPGCGKTELFEQLAEALGARYMAFLPPTMDPTDSSGVPHPVDGVTKFLPPEDFLALTDEAKDKSPLLAVFEDLPAADEAVFNSLLRLIQTREVGGRKVRDNVYLCATGNRVEDKAGARKLTTALASRFIHFELDVDVEAWCNYAIEKDIEEQIVAYVRARNDQLHMFDPNSTSDTFPCPRTLFMASMAQQALGGANPDNNSLFVALSGCCGKGWATEYMAWLKTTDTMVPADEIFADPEKCRVPERRDIDGIYATITSLAYAVKKTDPEKEDLLFDRTKAALAYALRMPQPEFTCVLGRDITQHIIRGDRPATFKAKIVNVPEFNKISESLGQYM